MPLGRLRVSERPYPQNRYPSSCLSGLAVQKLPHASVDSAGSGGSGAGSENAVVQHDTRSTVGPAINLRDNIVDTSAVALGTCVDSYLAGEHVSSCWSRSCLCFVCLSYNPISRGLLFDTASLCCCHALCDTRFMCRARLAKARPFLSPSTRAPARPMWVRNPHSGAAC